MRSESKDPTTSAGRRAHLAEVEGIDGFGEELLLVAARIVPSGLEDRVAANPLERSG